MSEKFMAGNLWKDRVPLCFQVEIQHKGQEDSPFAEEPSRMSRQCFGFPFPSTQRRYKPNYKGSKLL